MGDVSSAFNHVSVERIAGVTHRQLVHWDKTGLVRPSLRQASGRGSRRVYAFDDVVEIRVVATLREAGVSLQAIRKAVQFLRRHHAQLVRPLANLTFITDGKRVFTLTDDPAFVVDASGGGQVAFTVILIGKLVRKLASAVSVISAPREAKIKIRNGATYKAILTPDLEVGGYTVEIPDIPGCVTEGDTLEDARAMAKEAIELMLGLAGHAPTAAESKALLG